MLNGSIGVCLGNTRANTLPGSSRNSYTKNSAKQTPPTTIGMTTWRADHAYVAPPHAVPRMISPTPKMNRTVPMMSRVARAGGIEVAREPFLKRVPSMRSLRRSA
jgi:hypothetical protein